MTVANNIWLLQMDTQLGQ